ncbi:MAG: phenylalanine--tRNA ligase subunit alpha, partial [Candidatus Gastranaerophilales bacterium]|nr:phenylalanine--tRNA ligase subunit alpha [Candidatus Gastranaerophilales bacterium]
MKQKLESIKEQALKELETVEDLNKLEEINIKFLGRKGELNEIKKSLKDLPNDQKPLIGGLANKIANQIEEIIKEKHEHLYQKELNKKLQSEKIDITLPGDFIPQGKIHPLTSTVNEIVEIFQGLGFSLVEKQNSPEVETEHYNFDMLNFPPDHPAKDMQDTFYTQIAPNVVLRSQTSNSQIHEME